MVAVVSCSFIVLFAALTKPKMRITWFSALKFSSICSTALSTAESFCHAEALPRSVLLKLSTVLPMLDTPPHALRTILMALTAFF